MRASPADWILRGDPFHSNEKGRGHPFPAILEHLIQQRGLPVGDNLEAFLRPKLRDLGDPFEIGEMREGVARILQTVCPARYLRWHQSGMIDDATLARSLATLGVKNPA